MRKILSILTLTLVVATISQVSAFAADSISDGKKVLYMSAELGLPIDAASGQMSPRGLIYYSDDNFLDTKTKFEAAFMGIYLSLASSHWGGYEDVNYGGRLFSTIHYNADYVKYNNGDFIKAETFNGSSNAGELFVVKDFDKNTNGKLSYSLSQNHYYANQDTATTFILPVDNTIQAIVARVETKSLVTTPWGEAQEGYRLWADAGLYFADQYRAWGMPATLSAGKKDYQKYQLSAAYYAQPFGSGNGTVSLSANGRYGTGLDRLSMFAFGGVSTIIPDSIKLHGYFGNEFFSDNLSLLNLEYAIPVWKHESGKFNILTAYVSYDQAMMPVGSVRGIGLGARMLLSPTSMIYLDYGYGIDAVRGTKTGGSDITVKYDQAF